MGTVSDDASLAIVLRRIADLLSRDDADTSWSGYETDELRSEIQRLLGKTESAELLAEADKACLRVLFLPTGPLQETSLSSGWGREFLELALRIDQAL
jgi:hypothetical protein